MPTPKTPTRPRVYYDLRAALACALDNLPDVVGDPTSTPEFVAQCAADVAALAHLLGSDGPGDYPRILAYT